MERNRQPSLEILGRLAGNLRRLRNARGYTQERLGKLCGLTKNYIGNVEQEPVNISLANLEALAKGLNCREADLLTEGNEPSSPRIWAPRLLPASMIPTTRKRWRTSPLMPLSLWRTMRTEASCGKSPDTRNRQF
jgi:transcriptional regulator with XRE-family HTH domain